MAYSSTVADKMPAADAVDDAESVVTPPSARAASQINSVREKSPKPNNNTPINSSQNMGGNLVRPSARGDSVLDGPDNSVAPLDWHSVNSSDSASVTSLPSCSLSLAGPSAGCNSSRSFATKNSEA